MTASYLLNRKEIDSRRYSAGDLFNSAMRVQMYLRSAGMSAGVIDSSTVHDFTEKVRSVKEQLALPGFLSNKLTAPALSTYVSGLFRQSALSDLTPHLRDLSTEHFDQLLLVAALSRYGQERETLRSESWLLHHPMDFSHLPARDQLVTTYGVEQEFFNCDDTRALSNAFRYFDKSWLLTTDQSIDPGETFTDGLELISPVLDRNNIHRVMLFAYLLQAEGAQSTAYNRCALHVHAGIKNTFPDARLRMALIRQMLINYAELDDDLSFLNSSMTSPYSGPNRPKADFMQAVLKGHEEDLPEPTYQSSPLLQPLGRKQSRINLLPLHNYGTVEFRHHPGTINPRDIAHWIHFVNDFIRVSVDMVTGQPAHIPTALENERLHGIAASFKGKTSFARGHGFGF